MSGFSADAYMTRKGSRIAQTGKKKDEKSEQRIHLLSYMFIVQNFISRLAETEGQEVLVDPLVFRSKS